MFHIRRVVSGIALVVVLLVAMAPLPASADEGMASWYGQPFHGRHMYNGQIFDMNDPTTTAANIFPIGTWLKVTNPANGRSIVVQVRDRGLFKWALDLSYGAFKALDDPAKMMMAVRYEQVTGPDGAPATPPAPAPSAPATPPSQQPQPAAMPNQYVVAVGDTLTGIARRFGLDLPSLVRWNGLGDPNRISAGQRLALQAPSTPPPSPSSRGGSDQAAAPLVESKYHIVAPGDSMWSLARKYGTTPDRLVALNGLEDEDFIRIGQRLHVADGGDPVPPASAAASAAPAAESSYTIKPGDTLYGVAFRLGLSYAAIVELNGLDDPDLLSVGQTLRLP